MAPDDRTSRRSRASRDARSARIRRIVHALLFVAAAALMIDGLVGDRGLLALRRAQREHEELGAAIARQQAENARLREDIRRLTDDPAAIEEVARRELGMIRPGERVFILRDLPPAAAKP